MLRAYMYQSACFDRNGDHDQPQQGNWVIQRLVNGWWRNYVWPYHSREAAEKELHELGLKVPKQKKGDANMNATTVRCPDCGCRVEDHNAVNTVAENPRQPDVLRLAHCGSCGCCWRSTPGFTELVYEHLTRERSVGER